METNQYTTAEMLLRVVPQCRVCSIDLHWYELEINAPTNITSNVKDGGQATPLSNAD
ncbi:hypothetical protein BC943DRAFT_85297 [Umbelopsis sp. AD052]|nr:hypothetical protein BC943DRAFT_85297 [Umbelopsis sp. AD052]